MSHDDESSKKKDLTGLSELLPFKGGDEHLFSISLEPEQIQSFDQLDQKNSESTPETTLPDMQPISPSQILSEVSAPITTAPREERSIASYPFTLRIRGKLTTLEKEKLCDILSREKMGIREVDLEPQFHADHILLPRISEYSGVILVQALRGTSATMELLPSDQAELEENSQFQPEGIFVTSESDSLSGDSATQSAIHPAELIPITSDASWAENKTFRVIDVVTASATLETQAVEASRSPAYQEMLDALQRELRFKAYHKGANAIIHFSVQLQVLSLPTRYKLLVMGSAIKTV